jgi:lipoprotein-releasing system permease protein
LSTTAAGAGPFSAWERSLAGRYLRAKRQQGGVALISLISFIGITLAVAVLIIVMSVMNGFRAELLGRILGFGGHAFVTGGVLDPPERDRALSRIRAIPGVAQAYPTVQDFAVAGGASNYAPVVVRGMRAADVRAAPIIADNIRQGSLEGFGEGEYGGELILIGTGLASSLGLAAGDAIELISPNGTATAFGSSPVSKSYTVGGIFEVGMSDFDQGFIYMPLEQAQLFLGRETAVDSIEIKLEDPDRIAQSRPLIARAAGPAAIVTDWRDANRSYFGALQVERNVMRLILMLIVAIAAMNIISGLVMLVKNKGRDIAVLRTIGASQGSITRIFFMAGAAVGLAGTIAGLLLGVVFCTFIEQIQAAVEWVTGAEVFASDVYFLDRLPAKIEWAEVVIVTSWALLASCLATLPPSLRAAKLDPVEALRYE